MRKVLVFLSVGALLVLSGCAPDTKTEQSTKNPTSENAEQSSKNQEAPVNNNPQVKIFDPIPGAENLAAVITTDKGDIVFEFYPDKAPSTVANFITLTRNGFYDGTAFHRVESNFVIQGGDPFSKTGQGRAGTGDPGYKIKAEFNDMKHLEGTVAMARAQDPDSAGSQFYICLAPAPLLDGQYTVFGQVIKGMDVVKKIAVGDLMKSVKIVDKSEVK